MKKETLIPVEATQTPAPKPAPIPEGLPTIPNEQAQALAMMQYTASRLALLRAPFKPHEISKLPKPYKKDSAKGNCKECGQYHGLPAAHLDYVGHAALTSRLLEVDPFFNWEPVAVDEDGLPKVDKIGGLWIKLTVCGVTRLGYGDAQGKTGANAVKELIGDALRNAAMRFGAALDLWHKGGNLYDGGEVEEQAAPVEVPEIEALKKCTKLDELQKVFIAAYKKYTDNATRAALTKTKDEIKGLINHAAKVEGVE